MSIPPQLPTIADGPQGIVGKIADLTRKVREVDALAGAIPEGSLTTPMFPTGGLPGSGIISASSIVAGQLAAGAVTAGTIAANAVTAGTINAGAIQAGNFSAGAIATNDIQAGAITASKISVANLAAITANLGTVTAGIYQTSASGSRVMIGNSVVTSSGTYTGLVAVDGSGNITLLANAATGDISMTGRLNQGSSGLGNIQGVTQNAILLAQGSNLVDNYSLDSTDMTPFATGGGTITRDTTTYLTAPAAAKYVSLGSGDYVLLLKTGTTLPVALAGQVYSESCFVYFASANATDTLTFHMGFNWINSGFGVISGVGGPTITVWANQWTRIPFENQTAPALTAYMWPYIQLVAGPSGQVFYFDNILVTNQPSAQGSVVLADTITAVEIAAGTITATEIAATTITAGKMNVSTLSAITANMGSITAGTITGGTLQTAATDPRTVMDVSGLYATDGSAAKQFLVDATNGIQLLAGAGAASSAPATITVDWRGTIGGAISAQLYTQTVSSGSLFTAGVTPAGTTQRTTLLSLSADNTSDASNTMNIVVYDAAHVNGYGRAIITGAGKSDYIQQPNTQAFFIDGPYVLSFPALGAGAANAQTFTPTRHVVGNAQVLVGANGGFCTYSSAYNSGTNVWTVTASNPYAVAQGAFPALAFVVGL